MKTEDHVHQWVVVSGWFGRYKCGDCGCFAFRKATVTGIKSLSTLTPYTCSKTRCESYVKHYRKNVMGRVYGFCEEHVQEYDKRNGLSFGTMNADC